MHNQLKFCAFFFYVYISIIMHICAIIKNETVLVQGCR